MPELPEVETIACHLRPALTGRVVAQVAIAWARTIDRPDVASFQSQIVGDRFVSVGRRG